MPDYTTKGDWIAFADELGRPVKLHRLTVEHFMREGRAAVALTIALPCHTRPTAPESRWLTTSEAARAHIADVDGLTIEAARMAVKRAADAGDFESEGRGRDRRIDPVSFGAWRLRRRELNLARCDEPPGPEA